MTSQNEADGSGAQATRQSTGITTPNAASATEPVLIAVCCLVIILALVGGVGLASGLVLRHLVQTLPLWVGVALGWRRSRATGWIGLPLFSFWLLLMAFIWLYLLGISRMLSGHFSPLEIAMTIVVGAASLVGIAMFGRFKSSLSVASAASLFVVTAAIQWVCFRASFLPAIAHR
jgi:hypothetical protein